MDIWELIHQMEDLFVFVFVVVVEVLVSVGIEEFCNKNKIFFLNGNTCGKHTCYKMLTINH